MAPLRRGLRTWNLHLVFRVLSASQVAFGGDTKEQCCDDVKIMQRVLRDAY